MFSVQHKINRCNQKGLPGTRGSMDFSTLVTNERGQAVVIVTYLLQPGVTNI